MPGTTVNLHYGNGDSAVEVIQYVIDLLLREIRSRPPRRDARGRVLVDLSGLTGQPPIDLDAVAPGAGLGALDLTRIRVTVRADGAGADGAGADGVGDGLVVVLRVPAVTGPVRLVHRATALRAFFHEVLLPQLRRWVSPDVLGEPRREGDMDEEPAPVVPTRAGTWITPPLRR